MISIPESNTLLPRQAKLSNGNTIYLFATDATELVKIDFNFEAGAAYQPQLLCAAAANKMITTATTKLNSLQLSEFMDFRGVILETNNDILQSSISLYMLRKYADEVLPIVKDILTQPAFSEDDFNIWQNARRHDLKAMEQRSSAIARRIFYLSLFGDNHPLGYYATAKDVDNLNLQTVKDYFCKKYRLGECTIVVSGMIDDELLHSIDIFFGGEKEEGVGERITLAMPKNIVPLSMEQKIDGSVQTSVRIGRVLPLRWDDKEYARFILLTTLLGGYFGSRLMSNLREGKGYCYGIYARTQIYRGVIVFFITADVAQGTADDTIEEIFKEIDLLVKEPVVEEELNLVKTVISGDFIRSIDGIFERSARFCNMMGTDVTEILTDNMREAIKTTTAVQLQELAGRLLDSAQMTVCCAGF